MLPPLDLAAMLSVACRRCIHLIAELGLTSNQSAAVRRDAPDSTASTTRSRNSKEQRFGIDPPFKIRINAASFNRPSPPGNPDSAQPKSALSCATVSPGRAPASAAPAMNRRLPGSVGPVRGSEAHQIPEVVPNFQATRRGLNAAESTIRSRSGHIFVRYEGFY